MDLAVMLLLLLLLYSLVFWDIEDVRVVGTAAVLVSSVKSFRSSSVEKYLSIDLPIFGLVPMTKTTSGAFYRLFL